MTVTISAMGNIKDFIPEEKTLELKRTMSLKELKAEVGIPKERNLSFAVNGRVKKGDYQVADNDEIKFLMVVGAG